MLLCLECGACATAPRLVPTPISYAHVYVHGYNNDFTDPVQAIAQMWHFLGRQGVPVAYTWPAGGGCTRAGRA